MVIGAGIIGCGIARELSRYQLKVALVDKESDICRGTSRANNGMIHSGNNPQPGTLKAKHNVAGNQLYSEWAKELKFPFERIGAWMTARNKDQIESLEELMEKGAKNGVSDLELITDQKRLKDEEPNLMGIIAAVNAPTTGMVMPHLVVVALAENAVTNGVELILDTKVTGIDIETGQVKVIRTDKGNIETRAVVNAAGLYADSVANFAGLDSFKIMPRKGQYIVLDKDCCPVNRLIYPAPTKTSKGIGILPTTDGNLLLGPNAEDIEDKEDLSTTAEGIRYILEQTKLICPSIDESKIINNFAGIRAVADTDDFILGPTEIKGFFQAAGIQSPGLTSAPSIAKELAGSISKYLKVQEKKDFKAENEYKPRFARASLDEKKQLVHKDKRYGRIVCRCEEVTEYEVIQAIHSVIPVRTLDALKTRLRVGMGRCQGGFCTSRLLEILGRELNIPVENLTIRGSGSEILASKLRKGE